MRELGAGVDDFGLVRTRPEFLKGSLVGGMAFFVVDLEMELEMPRLHVGAAYGIGLGGKTHEVLRVAGKWRDLAESGCCGDCGDEDATENRAEAEPIKSHGFWHRE